MPNRWEQPAFFLQSGDPEAENAPSLLYPGQLGVRFTQVNPVRAAPETGLGQMGGRSKRYQLVKSDSSMTVAPYVGAVAWWSDQGQYLVTTNSPSTSQPRNRVAGTFRNSVTPGNFCCVMIQGIGLVKLIDGVTQANVVAGAYVIPSATNGKADVVASATAPTLQPIGQVAAGSTAGSATALFFNVTDLTVAVDHMIPETS